MTTKLGLVCSESGGCGGGRIPSISLEFRKLPVNESPLASQLPSSFSWSPIKSWSPSPPCSCEESRQTRAGRIALDPSHIGQRSPPAINCIDDHVVSSIRSSLRTNVPVLVCNCSNGIFSFQCSRVPQLTWFTRESKNLTQSTATAAAVSQPLNHHCNSG